MLRRTGVSDEYLGALFDYRTSDEFDPRTKAALALAEHMTDHPDREVGDDLFAQLREQFDEGEILELASMIGLFHYTNRVNAALGIEPTV